MKLAVKKGPKRKARIEIVPLIDIMFFLLATFVLVSFSMTENKGLRVNLPLSKSTDSSSSSPSKTQDSLTVTILENGSFALDKKEIDLTQLKQELTLAKQKNQELKLIVLGDQGSKLQDTISILDITKEIGIEGVTLRTKSK